MFAHPFEYKFRVTEAKGWPKLSMKVWRVDSYGKMDNIAYGVVNLPNKGGSFELEVPTWRPTNGWGDEASNFYLGGPPKLQNV